MCVARTLISWTASNNLVVWSITMVGHVKKCYGRFWPALWCYGLAQYEYLTSIPMQPDKDLNLQIAGDPCLTVSVRYGHLSEEAN